MPTANIPQVSDRLEKQMFDAVMRFAETGNPNHPDIPLWPASVYGKEETMIFDRTCEVRRNFDDKLLEIYGKAFPNLTITTFRNQVEEDMIQH